MGHLNLGPTAVLPFENPAWCEGVCGLHTGHVDRVMVSGSRPSVRSGGDKDVNSH